MTAETAELGREMFHCPSWCTVPLQEHREQLDGFEGGASHYSGLWETTDDFPVVGSYTEQDGTVPVDGWPGVWIAQDDPITPDAAREMATKLIAAAELAETP